MTMTTAHRASEQGGRGRKVDASARPPPMRRDGLDLDVSRRYIPSAYLSRHVRKSRTQMVRQGGAGGPRAPFS